MKSYEHKYNTRSKSTSTPSTTNLGHTNAVLNTETGKLEEYWSLRQCKDKELWINSFSNELGRLV